LGVLGFRAGAVLAALAPLALLAPLAVLAAVVGWAFFEPEALPDFALVVLGFCAFCCSLLFSCSLIISSPLYVP
jgi:hypothetical protein